ncbi:MAG: hypothetical protein OEY89_07030 [Gammaproteobacteria bacterium]|nr:hypothetical protein [Gammaproteobacteria bacterium]
MPSVTFALDESGAKGYSNNREKAKGELGVVAGVLVPTESLSRVTYEIAKITEKFKTDGKLHITDLIPSDQETLRNEIFSYLASVNARWVYEAMYVEGLYSNAQLALSLRENVKKSRRSSVKISGNEKKDLLHSELLLGAFGKAVAFCVDYVGNDVHLNVITDQLDAPIVKAFKDDVNRLLNIGKKCERKVTGFDTASQKVVSGSITTEITEDLATVGDFSGVSYEIAVSDTPLTLIADIIVNSVHHHLSSLQEQNPGCQLNTLESISGHQLASLVYGVTGQESDIPQVADTIFQYPSDA